MDKKRWIIGLRCHGCGARYFLAALNGGVSPSTSEELAKGIAIGDEPFICESNDNVRLEFCSCRSNN